MVHVNNWTCAHPNVLSHWIQWRQMGHLIAVLFWLIMTPLRLPKISFGYRLLSWLSTPLIFKIITTGSMAEKAMPNLSEMPNCVHVSNEQTNQPTYRPKKKRLRGISRYARKIGIIKLNRIWPPEEIKMEWQDDEVKTTPYMKSWENETWMTRVRFSLDADDQRTLGRIECLWNRRGEYWAICSFALSLTRTAHSFVCSALLASLARSIALIRSLAHSFLIYASL